MEWSFWEQELYGQAFDLVVIGGGFSGLSTAYFAKKRQPRWRIAVLDQYSIQRLASTRNAGFACISSLSELIEDAAAYGWEHTLSLIERRWKGLSMLEQIFNSKEIHYQNVPSGELFFEDQHFPFEKYADRIREANHLLRSIVGGEYYRLEDASLTQANFGAKATAYVHHLQEGQLQPARLAASWRKLCLESGITLFDGVKVHEIDRKNQIYQVSTEQMPLAAHRVLLAANGLSRQLMPSLEVGKVMNLVFVTKAMKGLKWKGNLHAESGFIYARNIDERILIGGGRHLLPKGQQEQVSPEDEAMIEDYLGKWLVEMKILDRKPEFEYKWKGYLGVGPEKEPILEAFDDRLFVLARLSGMGVALSTALGQKMGEKITAS